MEVMEVNLKMSIISEFMAFLKNYNVLALAVAFIIGQAASGLVSALVKDIVMPFIGLITPEGDWRSFRLSITGEVGKNELMIGDFLGQLIDFTVIAAVVFVIVKYVMKQDATKKV